MSEQAKVAASAGATTSLQFNANNSGQAAVEHSEQVKQQAGEETPEAKEARLKIERAAKYPGLNEEQIESEINKEKTLEKVKNMTPEEITAVMKLTFGDNWDGNIEEARKKLQKPVTEPTPEEKLAAEQAFEQRMVALHVELGGTVESYAALKNIAGMTDLSELTIRSIRQELKESELDLSDKEISDIIKERFYMDNIDELVKTDDETPEEFENRKKALQKKINLGNKKLENRGKSIKEKAVATLDKLRKSIEGSDLQKREEEQKEGLISSKTDEYLKNVPRKATIELGKGLDETDLAPISYDVSETDIEEVRKFLKDATQRNNLLQTKEGAFNVDAIATILLENRSLKRAVKVGYLQGCTDITEHFRKTFPFLNANDLGIGGRIKPIPKSGDKRVPASAGATMRV